MMCSYLFSRGVKRCAFTVIPDSHRAFVYRSGIFIHQEPGFESYDAGISVRSIELSRQPLFFTGLVN